MTLHLSRLNLALILALTLCLLALSFTIGMQRSGFSPSSDVTSPVVPCQGCNPFGSPGTAATPAPAADDGWKDNCRPDYERGPYARC